jgi:hypothetical protein
MVTVYFPLKANILYTRIIQFNEKMSLPYFSEKIGWELTSALKS